MVNVSIHTHSLIPLALCGLFLPCPNHALSGIFLWVHFFGLFLLKETYVRPKRGTSKSCHVSETWKTRAPGLGNACAPWRPAAKEQLFSLTASSTVMYKPQNSKPNTSFFNSLKNLLKIKKIPPQILPYSPTNQT